MLTEKVINCGGCGQLLKIPNRNQVAARQIQCPKCGKLMVVNFVENMACSEMPDDPDDGSTTVYASGQATSMPRLEIEGRTYALRDGENVVGRRATTSTAHIQLPVKDMYMGRHHAVITMKTDTTGSTVCTLKALDAKNGLSVNHIPVGEGEEVTLLDGAVIKMGKSFITYRK